MKLFDLKDGLHLNKKHGCKALAWTILKALYAKLRPEACRTGGRKDSQNKASRKNINRNRSVKSNKKGSRSSDGMPWCPDSATFKELNIGCWNMRGFMSFQIYLRQILHSFDMFAFSEHCLFKRATGFNYWIFWNLSVSKYFLQQQPQFSRWETRVGWCWSLLEKRVWWSYNTFAYW